MINIKSVKKICLLNGQVIPDHNQRKVRMHPFFVFLTGLLMVVNQTMSQPHSNVFINNAFSTQVSSKTSVSVIDCGAKGDGIHNDAPAIQKALDSGATIVTIPPGIYNIGQTLLIGSGVTLSSDPKAIIRLADKVGNHVSIFLLANRNPGNGNNNIIVEGGIWDGNNEHNCRGADGDLFGYTGTAINFINVKNLVIRNLTVRNPDAFSIRLGEVQDFIVEDVTLDHSIIRPNQDGIHVGGFSQGGIIRRIQAIHPDTPNDDMIAINADDDVERVLNLGMRCGPIRDILIEDIFANGAYNFVRLLSKESRIDNINIRHITGSCRYYAVNVNNWRFPIGSGDIRNVRFEDFKVKKTLYKKGAPALFHITLNISDFYFHDIQRVEDQKNSQVATLMLENKCNNTILNNGNKQRNVSKFLIQHGGIKELWINKSDL